MIIPVGGTQCRCHGLVLYTLIIIIIFFTTFMNVSDYKYGKHYHDYNGPGDIAVDYVAGDFSAIFCSSYNVTPTTRADVFLVSGKAQVNTKNRTIERRQAFQLFPNSRDRRNAFYILEGSVIKVSACMFDTNIRKDIHVLLFKGDNSWSDWADEGCEDCAIRRVHVAAICTNTSETVLNFFVEDRDTYYITVTKGNDHDVTFVDVLAELEVNRTTFDTGHAQQTCRNATTCLFELPYASTVDAVVKFDDQNVISFSTMCILRASTWVGLFILLPIVITGLGFAYYFYACRGGKGGQKQTSSSGTINSDSTKLVSSEFSPEYRSTFSEKV